MPVGHVHIGDDTVDTVAAIATAAAAVIAALALRTSARAAAATERQTEALTRPLLTSIATGGYLTQEEHIVYADGISTPSPIYAQVLVGGSGDDQAGRASFMVRNIGDGIARVQGAEIIDQRTARCMARDGEALIGKGDQHRFTFVSLDEEGWSAALNEGGPLVCEVTYEDFARLRTYRLTVELRRHHQRGWLIDDVA